MISSKKKKRQKISGWIILDKPIGMRSTQAVAEIKKIFNAEKVGHAGTLDPLTSGVLPIALGEATKIIPYMQNGFKVYRFTVGWGEERTTDDCEGEITKRSEKYPSKSAIEKIIENYTGIIVQVPPQFSAIKIQGERAYKRARRGEIFEIKEREVTIKRFDLIEYRDNSAIFEICCSKGTYVRSLARDMGRDLGCFGYIQALRRTKVEPFYEDDCITMHQLQKTKYHNQDDNQKVTDILKSSFLQKPELALTDFQKFTILPEEEKKVKHGMPIVLKAWNDKDEKKDKAYLMSGDCLVAIGCVCRGLFTSERVFNAVG